jgi:hypothetical protein
MPRPFAVDDKTFSDNWARIFGAKPNGSLNKVGNENGEPKSDAIEAARTPERLS